MLVLVLVPPPPPPSAAALEGGESGILALQQCAENSKLCEAHFTIGSDCSNITDPLAAFLIGAGSHAYFGCGSWHVHDNTGRLAVGTWHQCFTRPLGEPRGLAEVSGPPGCDSSWLQPTWTDPKRPRPYGCTFRRAFASGTVVTFDGASNVGSIAWSDSTSHEDPAHSCDTP